MKNYEYLQTILQEHAYPLIHNNYDRLLESIGNASIVLLGEASHGTAEFYNARVQITKQLIKEKGFNLIALEADWPDAYRVNRYIISQESSDTSSIDSLADFKRFPAWMWRNQEMVAFITWLHEHNTLQDVSSKVNLYGLDLYSLHRSMQVIVEELKKTNPQAAQIAQERYKCFDSFGINPQTYGYFASIDPSVSCQKKVMEQFMEIKKNASHSLKEKIDLEQNACVVKNAENYYRSLFQGSPANSWNIRDHHMMETLDSLIAFAKQYQQPPKIVVWAHNSHLGDARATQMSSFGEVNVGQLIKEKYGNQSFSVGFTTYTGTVSAASSWDSPVERKMVRPAINGSYEALFHAIKIPDFLLCMDNPYVYSALDQPLLERAIGVIYAPQTERESHYFHANLAQQFNAVIHCDTTHAVIPLDKNQQWEEGEFPETFPFGV